MRILFYVMHAAYKHWLYDFYFCTLQSVDCMQEEGAALLLWIKEGLVKALHNPNLTLQGKEVILAWWLLKVASESTGKNKRQV